MSLALQVDEIEAVLIDRWYMVAGGTFVLDAYEFCDGKYPTHIGDGTGFRFDEYTEDFDGRIAYPVCGPLHAITAIRLIGRQRDTPVEAPGFTKCSP